MYILYIVYAGRVRNIMLCHVG